jgi:hypothetical protein
MKYEIPHLQFKRTQKGGGSYVSTDNRFYIYRNEDKYWAWGRNIFNDNGEIVNREAGDDSQYQTKELCTNALLAMLKDEAYDQALWEN